MKAAELSRLAGKDPRLVVGLISGTSADAAEAALCRVFGSGPSARLELLCHASIPFERELQERIVSANTAKEICALDAILGERFATAALAVIAQAGLAPQDVDLIGSHGQTVAHLPPHLALPPSTLQIGEASVIAERTGVTCVCDFRARDMAAGGNGAPLVPYAEWALWRKPGAARAFLNIGGIANLSVVTDTLSDTLAFDTGPGNMVLDALARRATGGKERCDRDGKLSRRGQPAAPLLEQLLGHPYLALPPPKSCGREQFGEAFAQDLWEQFHGDPDGLVATAAVFTVEAVARSFEQWVFPRGIPAELLLSGGGSRNPVLVSKLRERLHPLPVRSFSELGIPEEAKEACCFALLASECVLGVAQNVPSATGALRSVVMGKVIP